MSYQYYPKEQDFLDRHNPKKPSIPILLWFDDIINGLNGAVSVDVGELQNTKVVSNTYTVLSTDNVIFCDTTSGAFTVTLPALIQSTRYKIVNIGTSGNDVTLASNGSELIFGSSANEVLHDLENFDLNGDLTVGWN